jgi:hypothetical protein
MTVIGSITFNGDRLTFAPLGALSVLQQAQAQLVGKI